MATESVIEYNDYYLSIDPRVRYGRENPTLPYCFDFMHTSDSEIDRSEYYSWLSKYDQRYYIAAQWTSDKGEDCYAAFQRTARQGHVTPQQIALFERVLPHLRRGVEVTRRLEEADLRVAASRLTLDRLPYGVAILDAAGNVLIMNRAAVRIAAEGDGIDATGAGLAILHRPSAGAYKRILADTLTGEADRPSRAGGTVAVERPSGRRSYLVTVTPLPGPQPIFTRHVPAAAVFISDPESQERPPEDAFREMFGLTPAEAGLAACLSTGLPLDACADLRGITRATARTYLKRIFAKTGTSRQAELVRLLLAIPAAYDPE